MNHMGGIGGYSSSTRWRKTSLGKRGEKALSTIEPEQYVNELLGAHNDSDALRQFAERFRHKKNDNEDSTAHFELDQETGEIHVSIFEAETGRLQLTLTPDEVAEGLKNLEESDESASTLSSFFIDIKV